MPGVVYTITREKSKLFAQLTGQEKFEIFPYEEDKFFYKIVDANINFIRDDEGNVTNLVLYQMGQEILAIKTK